MSESADFHHLDPFFKNIDFVVPGYGRSSQYMVALHDTFYRWARAWVQGLVVLDAGCGEGYGVAILAEKAERAVGIDIKPQLIEHARRRYPASNLEFQVMDCEALKFADGSFDVIVCDELLEHLPNYENFLGSARRVLRAGGLFICATTNRKQSFMRSDGSPLNRNHYQEFDAVEFQKLLERYFQDLQIFSEKMNPLSKAYFSNPQARGIEWLLVRLGIKHKIPIGLRNFIRERVTGVKVDQMISHGFEIVEGVQNDAHYLIGVARKA